MRHVVLLLLVLALTACGGAGDDEKASAEPSNPFAYDRSRDLAVRDEGVINPGYPIAVHDISFASPKDGRVPAYLIVPPGKGPYPAVIYMHGAGGNRLDFVAPGSWMAARRAVALTIDSPFVRKPAPAIPGGLPGLRRERDLSVQTVVDLRRAVDYLESLPQVDPERIAFVGYSAGARTGAILAGVEPRIKAFVLIAGGAPSVAEFARRVPRSNRREVTRILTTTDGLRYIRKAPAGTRFLFQNGLRDEVVPRRALQAMIDAAPEPKDVRWYSAGHGLNLRVFQDHLEWLARTLGARGPAVEGAITGP
jgi:dienelactone hydrolase